MSWFLLYVLGLEAFSKFSGEGPYQNMKTSILLIYLILVIWKLNCVFWICGESVTAVGGPVCFDRIYLGSLSWRCLHFFLRIHRGMSYVVADHFTSQHSRVSLPLGVVYLAEKKRQFFSKCWLDVWRMNCFKYGLLAADRTFMITFKFRSVTLNPIVNLVPFINLRFSRNNNNCIS